MSKIKFYKDSAKTQQVYPELDPEDITKFESLEDIENAFPNVSGEDTGVTLNHTVEAPMKLELAPSELWQKTTTGKNLWGGFEFSKTNNGVNFTSNKDGSVTASGTANGTAFSMISSEASDYYKTLPAGTYTISGGVSVNQRVQVLDSSGTELANSGSTSSSFTLSETKQIWIRVRIASEEVVNTTYNIQLEEGSATSYEPYTGGQPQPNPDFPSRVHSVSGDNEIRIDNKNMYNSDFRRRNGNIYITNGNGDESGGVFTLTATGSDMRLWEVRTVGMSYNDIAGQLYEFTNDTYTVTVSNPLLTKNFITYYDENKTSLGFIQKASNIFTFSKNNIENAKYFTLRIGYGSAVIGTKYEFTVQMESGNSSTSYVKNEHHYLPLNLGDLEYCKIGDYSDEFFKNDPSDPNYDSTLELDRWYLKKNINKVIFNGTENWQGPVSEGFYLYTASWYNLNHSMTICDNFRTFLSMTQYNQSKDAAGFLYSGVSQYYIKKDGITSSNDLKSWFSTHNTIVYYILSTPTYILLDDTLQHQLDDIYNWVESYPGQTNISQINNDLPFIISAHAMKDLSVIDKYPTEDSEHLVESGGVYEVVNDINERISDIDKIRHDSKNVVYGGETGVTIDLDDAYDTDLVGLELSKETTQETTTGINLANTGKKTITQIGVTTNYDGGRFICNGTTTGANSIIGNQSASSSQAIDLGLFTAGVYSFHFQKTSGTITIPSGASAWYIRSYSGSQIAAGDANNTANKTGTFTLNEDGHLYFQVFTNTADWVYNNVIFEFMIVSGSTLPENWEKATYGASPNPLYPQEVKTVKGYRNLFDKNSVTATSLNADGTTSDSATLSTTDFIEIDSSKTYYKTLTGSSRVKLYDVNKNVISTSSMADISDFSKAQSFAIPYSNAKYIRITMTNGNVNSFQLVEGASSHPYVPYGNNYVDVKVTGKNLIGFDNETYTSQGINWTVVDNVITMNGTAIGNWSNAIDIKTDKKFALEPGAYVLSTNHVDNFVKIYKYIYEDTNGQSQTINFAVERNQSKGVPLTIPEGAKFQRCVINIIGITSGTSYNTSFSLMLEENNMATEFEPYKESIVTIPLNNNEIVGIDDYKDELLVDKNGNVFINKKTGKVVLNGSEDWITWTNNRLTMYQPINYKKVANNQTSLLLSNYYKRTTRAASSTNFSMCFYSSTDNVYGIILCDDINNTAELLKTWLSTHNTEVYYVLETPQLIELPPVDIALFDGINHISNSEDADMEITYVKDINIVINKLTNAIIEIGGE